VVYNFFVICIHLVSHVQFKDWLTRSICPPPTLLLHCGNGMGNSAIYHALPPMSHCPPHPHTSESYDFFLFVLIFTTMENGLLPPWKFVSFSRAIKWRCKRCTIYTRGLICNINVHCRGIRPSWQARSIVSGGVAGW